MDLRFYLDQKLLVGEVTRFHFESYMWFNVTLSSMDSFNLFMNEDGFWKSDMYVNFDLVSSIGSEIEILDDFPIASFSDPIKYTSARF